MTPEALCGLFVLRCPFSWLLVCGLWQCLESNSEHDLQQQHDIDNTFLLEWPDPCKTKQILCGQGKTMDCESDIESTFEGRETTGKHTMRALNAVQDERHAACSFDNLCRACHSRWPRARLIRITLPASPAHFTQQPSRAFPPRNRYRSVSMPLFRAIPVWQILQIFQRLFQLVFFRQ